MAAIGDDAFGEVALPLPRTKEFTGVIGSINVAFFRIKLLLSGVIEMAFRGEKTLSGLRGEKTLSGLRGEKTLSGLVRSCSAVTASPTPAFQSARRDIPCSSSLLIHNAPATYQEKG